MSAQQVDQRPSWLLDRAEIEASPSSQATKRTPTQTPALLVSAEQGAGTTTFASSNGRATPVGKPVRLPSTRSASQAYVQRIPAPTAPPVAIPQARPTRPLPTRATPMTRTMTVTKSRQTAKPSSSSKSSFFGNGPELILPKSLAGPNGPPSTKGPTRQNRVQSPRPAVAPTQRQARPVSNQPSMPVVEPYVMHPSQAPVVSQPLVYSSPMVQSVPCTQCGTPCQGNGPCGHCADRDGQGMIEEFNYANGICTGTKDEFQCWQDPACMPFNTYRQGGYAGPARTQHLMEYRLRPGDVVQFTYLLSDQQINSNYRLTVGDELLIESEADEALTRGTLEKGLEIQPDGTITLRYIGQVQAAGQTIDQLRATLNRKYAELDLYEDPAIDVTPVLTGTSAKRIRDAISGTGGFTAQFVVQTVTPQGEVRLPKLGSIPAHGLTLTDLKREVNLRYQSIVGGIEVEPSLQSQAPHYVYVLGEVATPGRFNIDQPTTVLGAIALAGGHVPGANLRQVVVFRRGENWELLSTLLDLRGAILGRKALPRDEIWLQDGDVVILPSMPIRLFDNFVRLVFTEGIYGIVPFQGYSIDLGDDN